MGYICSIRIIYGTQTPNNIYFLIVKLTPPPPIKKTQQIIQTKQIVSLASHCCLRNIDVSL